jgi:hypothetical protein
VNHDYSDAIGRAHRRIGIGRRLFGGGALRLHGVAMIVQSLRRRGTHSRIARMRCIDCA